MEDLKVTLRDFLSYAQAKGYKTVLVGADVVLNGRALEDVLECPLSLFEGSRKKKMQEHLIESCIIL